jgi:hypothetical protein
VPTGYDPDRHDGTVERFIVISPVVDRAVMALAARAEWRRIVKP